MAKTIPTAGYDDDGNMTVYELAPGEILPPGVHPLPPKGTHPHERELGMKPEPQPEPEPEPEPQPEPVKRGPGRPPKLPRPGDD